ncbi:MAG: deoxyguanosinetriphosphate triphosphohydrolase [Candidatus Thiodiazotropha lotti]|uniref:Deoxyguanosinetriphosphate triphosphohydrolase n=1 Tax=Candidatus Thiodiazotropha lotti TaxID=2792787 RepID=A0A9E4K325_9GAMM|nr:deoxyguanosinetriphosphate triphosphohydrolase [Candidatus Thiodiazotropha lotti]MCG7922436.1 deoxyguanosinetriphosphate triphosphohydrolase [Candidatus Thiodiazotropha lotti]MCG7937874.1 deoxyguanosinetriphosphate triphosphohydrolase [Candidatus Thiodiazotropha lotti]MCG8003527.1 deoxyguanosinetriphosphate triphosphohydrolase [Candidatus Thiodiazotropha lotti]MCG8009466.1 deoxyguanosinetriphosphate triphosphohydrolase [Candidatus Thiodiazotropha lotti]
MSMNWSQLLSRQRLGSKDQPTSTTSRTDFQRDFDRIVFSSAFRRMQDKTQIFPLSKIDYVRTRLTHSLESSSVGRSLGTLVGEQIIARHKLKGYEASDFGDICAAACLAHDIGNPPFGHSGEDAIRHWAETADYGRQRVAVLNGSQREDFLNFEGNAQGFRVITRLQNRDNPGGLQLTCATLAAFTKYPRESCIGKGRFDGVSAKKPGFTAQDQENFETVAKAVGLIRRDPVLSIWHRHPLSYLVEAADDICYRVIDIEDGFRLGHLSYQQALDLYSDILADSSIQTLRLKRIGGDKEKVEFLRAKVISKAISEILSCFLDHEPAILKGEFDDPLMSSIPHRKEMDRLIQVAGEKIYIAPEVIEIETAGFQVISELLERFIPIIDDVAEHGTDATPRSQMMIRLIPEQFIGDDAIPVQDDYTRLLRLTDFVSGMTDSYAVSLYKKVTGISLPG